MTPLPFSLRATRARPGSRGAVLIVVVVVVIVVQEEIEQPARRHGAKREQQRINSEAASNRLYRRHGHWGRRLLSSDRGRVGDRQDTVRGGRLTGRGNCGGTAQGGCRRSATHGAQGGPGVDLRYGSCGRNGTCRAEE